MTCRFIISCFAILVLIGFVPDQALGQDQAQTPHQLEIQSQSQARQGALVQMIPIACHDKTNILAGLESNYGEIVMARGVHSAGVLIEVLASGVGTFTILVTMPANPDRTCILALGTDFEIIAPPSKVDESL